jgi:hypothetical protein
MLIFSFLCAGYLPLHFLLYFALRRTISALRSERSIFLYHFGSALAFTVAFGCWALASESADAWVWFTAAVMLHGMYSLSFLELWALADDSYSLAILAAIEAAEDRSEKRLAGELSTIGQRKQKSRLNSLLRLRLVRSDPNGDIVLTGLARTVIFVSKRLLFLANVQRHG